MFLVGLEAGKSREESEVKSVKDEDSAGLALRLIREVMIV